MKSKLFFTVVTVLGPTVLLYLYYSVITVAICGFFLMNIVCISFCYLLTVFFATLGLKLGF